MGGELLFACSALLPKLRALLLKDRPPSKFRGILFTCVLCFVACLVLLRFLLCVACSVNGLGIYIYIYLNYTYSTWSDFKVTFRIILLLILTTRSAPWFVGRLIDLLVGWLVSCLVAWLVSCLVG